MAIRADDGVHAAESRDSRLTVLESILLRRFPRSGNSCRSEVFSCHAGVFDLWGRLFRLQRGALGVLLAGNLFRRTAGSREAQALGCCVTRCGHLLSAERIRGG